MLLALIERAKPITAHQIVRIYEDSPVSNFNTSKGTVYPIVRRLREAGMIKGRKVRGDGRGTEQLETTKKGVKAIRRWVADIRPSHLLPEDPLRTKIQSFDLLTKGERIEWISDVKISLIDKLDELERYREEVSVPFQDLVHEHAIRSIRSRMDWLDLALHQIIKGSD